MPCGRRGAGRDLHAGRGTFGSRGDGRDRALESLVRIGASLEKHLAAHPHVSDVVLGDRDLRGERPVLVHLDDQISLVHHPVLHLLEVGGRRRDDSVDRAHHVQEPELLLQVSPLGFEALDLRPGGGDLFRSCASDEKLELAPGRDEIVLGRGGLFLGGQEISSRDEQGVVHGLVHGQALSRMPEMILRLRNLGPGRRLLLRGGSGLEQLELGPALLDVCLGLLQLGREIAIGELGDRVALPHPVPFVHVNRFHHPVHLGAQIGILNRQDQERSMDLQIPAAKEGDPDRRCGDDESLRHPARAGVLPLDRRGRLGGRAALTGVAARFCG